MRRVPMHHPRDQYPQLWLLPCSVPHKVRSTKFGRCIAGRSGSTSRNVGQAGLAGSEEERKGTGIWGSGPASHPASFNGCILCVSDKSCTSAQFYT